jgi:inner membrane protein
MMGYTHAAGGAFAGAVVGGAFGDPVLGAAVGVLAGLLPDIDHPGSMLSRKVPIVPVLVSALAGHRQLTHTVWFALGVAMLAAVFLAGLAPDRKYLAVAVFAGALSHVLLDGLTRGGVRPLAPLPLHLKGPLNTGDILTEGPLAFLLAVLAFQTLI